MRRGSFQAVSPAGLVIEAVTTEPDRLLILARPTEPDAACPECGRRSAHVHSRYDRKLMDLPSHGRAVHLRIRVRRFRCAAVSCPGRSSASRSQTASHLGRPDARLGSRPARSTLAPSTPTVAQVKVAPATPSPSRMPARRETAIEVEVTTTQTGPGLRQARIKTPAIPASAPTYSTVASTPLAVMRQNGRP